MKHKEELDVILQQHLAEKQRIERRHTEAKEWFESRLDAQKAEHTEELQEKV